MNQAVVSKVSPFSLKHGPYLSGFKNCEYKLELGGMGVGSARPQLSPTPRTQNSIMSVRALGTDLI